MILSAQTIRNLSKLQPPMISPFCERGVTNGRSYGLSSCGYDVRIDFNGQNRGSAIYMSPPDMGLAAMGISPEPSLTFILTATIERFDMPLDVLGVVHDKSSWARQGLAVQNTIIEPGWRGYLTLELTYHGSGGLVLTHGDPIAQIIFHRLDRTTEQPYVGKYQDQAAGPQEARFE